MVGSIKELAKFLGCNKAIALQMVHNPKYARAVLYLGKRKRRYDTQMFIELSRGGN